MQNLYLPFSKKQSGAKDRLEVTVNYEKDTCVDVKSCQDSSQGMKEIQLSLVPRLLDAFPASGV